MRDKPIIDSLLDLDFYKPNMMQLQFRKHRNVPVKFAMTNRTKSVRLADTVPIERLREELAHVRTLRHSADEIAFYRGTGLYDEDFLDFLHRLQLPDIDVTEHDGQIAVETALAPWCEVTPWETIVLSIVSELHFRSVLTQSGIRKEDVYREGERRLWNKLSVLRSFGGVKCIEFGTRRRPFREWQRFVVDIFRHEAPEMLAGTSNVALAKEFALAPKGTMAHELFMGYACIRGGTDEGLRASHNEVLRDWEEMYGPKLLVALTDTFGSGFFFRDFTPEQAARWTGLRQDSGDPVAFGQRAVAFYERLGIDPTAKALVPSDGLSIDTIFRIEQALGGMMDITHGWGTTLSNDLGFKTLSLVMKMVEAAARPAVKLSDNPAKAMGPPDEVARYKRVFGYEEGAYEECVV